MPLVEPGRAGPIVGVRLPRNIAKLYCEPGCLQGVSDRGAITAARARDRRQSESALIGEIVPAGAALDVSGQAEVRARDARQKFKVSMDARVDDGTTFVVKTNGRIVDVSRIEFGDGQLELDSGRNNDNNGAPGGHGRTENRSRFFFSPTGAGVSIGAKGHVDIRVRGQRQKLTVEVEANVPDDSTFLVVANGEAIGAIRIALGEGEVELKNFDGQILPPAVDPVTGVRRVEVTDADGVLILGLDL